MFKDQNGDGLADGAPGKQKMKRDAFIDTNGDGICDTREQGLGFKRLNKQTGKQATQHRGGKK